MARVAADVTGAAMLEARIGLGFLGFEFRFWVCGLSSIGLVIWARFSWVLGIVFFYCNLDLNFNLHLIYFFYLVVSDEIGLLQS